MPLYEYVCEETGDVIELLRPMGAADEPVEDPERKGRRFVRRVSVFAAGGNSGASGASSAGGSSTGSGGCCPCGKGRGACSRGA